MCINFIKIGQVVWLYRQFEVANNRFYSFMLSTMLRANTVYVKDVKRVTDRVAFGFFGT